MTAPKELLERIQLRLEDSYTGIGEVVADMPAADLADLLNQLTVVEAATILTMLPIPRVVCDLDDDVREAEDVSLPSRIPVRTPREEHFQPPRRA